MAKFSERYGYTSPSSVLVREQMTQEIRNGICTTFDLLREKMGNVYYGDLNRYLWCGFLNKRLNDFHYGSVATEYIESDIHPWYHKLDIIEQSLWCFEQSDKTNRNFLYRDYLRFFVTQLNYEFQRHNFAYRIIDNKIVEITSQEEVAEIETALQNPSSGVREHLHTALKLMSKRPEGDYRNSIKESISAVEVVVREITGAKTLKTTELERAGIVLPSVLKQSFEKLYGYTNDATTGIRHALMDDANAPGADEAMPHINTRRRR